MTIDTDQATLDRWLADGTWVKFAPGESSPGCAYHTLYVTGCSRCRDKELPRGEYPPADWEADQTCDICFGPLDTKFDNPIPDCPNCKGTSLRRHPVTVRCPNWSRHWIGQECEHCNEGGIIGGRITVAWATVEWGPLPVVGEHDDADQFSHRVEITDQGLVILYSSSGGVMTARLLTLPPDIDPQSLVGQWARGGTVGVAS